MEPFLLLPQQVTKTQLDYYSCSITVEALQQGQEGTINSKNAITCASKYHLPVIFLKQY